MTSFRRTLAVAQAWAALFWERNARVWWPALALPAAFAALALFGVWDRFGDPWRLIALVAAAAGATGLIARGLVRGRWPGPAAARRRVEEDSGLGGRPFEALQDEPVEADPAARALWRAHQQRMRASLADARARRPRAAWARVDRYAVRGALVVVAVVGLGFARADAPRRLSEAFAFRLILPASSSTPIEAWLDPPAYTGRSPVFLQALDGREAEAPAGSQFVARVAGVRRAPQLLIDTETGSTQLEFERDEAGGYRVETTLAETSSLHVVGPARAGWRVHVVPDAPPQAAFAEPPEAGAREALNFRFGARDDYGVHRLSLEIGRLDPTTNEVTDRDIVPIDIAPAREIEDRAERIDLTEHRWAGLEVALRLLAYDGLDQEGASRAVVMTLPQRLFTEPLARAIAHERATLLREDLDYAPLPETDAGRALTAEDAAARPAFRLDNPAERLARAPEAVRRLREALELLTIAPELFSNDFVVHMGLSYVSDRLAIAQDESELAGLEDVLWDAALRAEGGDLADAERAMRAAERALAAALARGASEEEILRLTEEYRQAVNRYLEALRQQAIEEGRISEASGGGGDGMNTDELQELLQALEDLAETGATGDARRLLQALTEMLANMEMQLTMGGSGGGEPLNMDGEMRELLEELSELMGEQRELMDQTLDQAEGREPSESGATGEQPGSADGAQPGSSPGASPGSEDAQPGSETGDGGSDAAPGGPRDLAAMQRALRDLLNELREDRAGGGGEDGDEPGAGGAEDENGEAGAGSGADDALADAERAMGAAEGALRDGDEEGALAAQGDALERLREAAEGFAREALANAGNRREGQVGDARPGSSDAMGRDPFGRRSGGRAIDDGLGVEVPDEADRERAREILDELRRRAGESDRERDELDYIRRLLDRF